MRVIKDADTRKDEILSGALKVFAQKGYDKTTITDIAKELGISQGLCYRYYTSKEEIYDAALEKYSSYIVSENLHRFSLSEGTLKEKIQQYSGNLEEYRQPEKDDELLYSLFHGANSKKMHDQLMMKTAEKLVPYIKKVLEDALAKGEIHICDVDVFAYFFVYGQVGLLLSQGDNPECKKKIQNLLIRLLDLE